MVKQTAQMLQAFGTELAETELPNDVQSTSSVLRAHTEKKDRAKVWATVPAPRQGWGSFCPVCTPGRGEAARLGTQAESLVSPEKQERSALSMPSSGQWGAGWPRCCRRLRAAVPMITKEEVWPSPPGEGGDCNGSG